MKQKHTKHRTIYTTIQCGNKTTWKNVIKGTAIYAANLIRSIYLLIMLSTLLLNHHSTSVHFAQLHFTPLHYTCRHFTSSHWNFTELHFSTLSFSLTPFKFIIYVYIYIYVTNKAMLTNGKLQAINFLNRFLCFSFRTCSLSTDFVDVTCLVCYDL